METVGPAFVLVEVLAWGIQGPQWGNPLLWALYNHPVVVPGPLDGPRTVPEEAISKCLFWILGGRQPGA